MTTAGAIASIIKEEDLLQHRIERALDRCGFAEPAYKVGVMIRNGIAHLSGSVRYEDEIAVVGALVLEIGGVTGVVNRILYREPRPEHTSSSNGKEGTS